MQYEKLLFLGNNNLIYKMCQNHTDDLFTQDLAKKTLAA